MKYAAVILSGVLFSGSVFGAQAPKGAEVRGGKPSPENLLEVKSLSVSSGELTDGGDWIVRAKVVSKVAGRPVNCAADLRLWGAEAVDFDSCFVLPTQDPAEYEVVLGHRFPVTASPRGYRLGSIYITFNDAQTGREAVAKTRSHSGEELVQVKRTQDVPGIRILRVWADTPTQRPEYKLGDVFSVSVEFESASPVIGARLMAQEGYTYAFGGYQQYLYYLDLPMIKGVEETQTPQGTRVLKFTLSAHQGLNGRIPRSLTFNSIQLINHSLDANDTLDPLPDDLVRLRYVN